MAGPDGLRYLLNATDDSFTLTPGFLTPYPEGLLALEGNDVIIGSIDSELILGFQGKDVLRGSSGNDSLFGGTEADEIYGEDGNDILNGNIGSDFIVGGTGNDLIRGGKDNDFLVGGEGNDTLIGDFGQDALKGSGGSDLFVIRTDNAVSQPLSGDVILDFDASSDAIGLTGGLTEANLVFQAFSIPLLSLSSLVDITQIPQAALSEINLQQIDPNGDGSITGIYIGTNTGQWLGGAINVTQAELTGRFVSVNF